MSIYVSRDDNETLLLKPKLIVGLRNPGKEYENTRHNAGFMALEKLVKSWNKSKLSSEIYEETGHPKIIYAAPTTYMNNSGRAVQALQDYYQINSEDILVLHDDKDLDFGVVKYKFAGSSAGHNGIKSIDNAIGEQYWRCRIGIANENLQYHDTSDFVLAKFSKSELENFPKYVDVIQNIIEDFKKNKLK